MVDDPVLVTEASRLLECSEDTVRRLEATGVLPARRTAAGVRVFERVDVLRLASERANRAHRNSVNGGVR